MTDLEFELFDDSSSDVDIDARIEAFEAQVAREIKILGSRKASMARRIKAAEWLGNSGAPQAIEMLVRAYQQKKDAELKQAAAYALGQFKALYEAIDLKPGESIDNALVREENRALIDLLSQIAVEGRVGKRKRVSARTLIFAQIGLVISLVVLIALNVLLGSSSGKAAASPGFDLLNSPVPTRAPGLGEDASLALDALEALRQRFSSVVTDNLMLQGNLTAARDSGSLDCAASFYRPSPYEVPPVVDSRYPTITVLSNRLTAQINELNVVHLVRDDACTAGTGMSPAQIEIQIERLQQIYAALPGVLQAIMTLEDSLNTAAAADLPPDEDEPSAIVEETSEPEVPTEIPEPTIDAQTVNTHLLAMVNIIDTVNAQRGANTLLQQYWADVQRGGRTDGCRLPPPEVPTDYGVPVDLLEREPLLSDSLTQVNVALALLRDAWISFQQSCAEDNLVSAMSLGLARLQTADFALEGAIETIRALQTDLRQRP